MGKSTLEKRLRAFKQAMEENNEKRMHRMLLRIRRDYEKETLDNRGRSKNR